MFNFAKCCLICSRTQCMLTDLTCKEDDIKMIYKLMFCVPEIKNVLTMTEEQGFHSKLCHSCRINLQICYMFKQTCLKLRALVGRFNIKAEEFKENRNYADQILESETKRDRISCEDKICEILNNNLEDQFPELDMDNVFSDVIIKQPKAKPMNEIFPMTTRSRSLNADKTKLRNLKKIITKNVHCKVCRVKMFQDKSTCDKCAYPKSSFPCKICGQAFTFNNELLQHMECHKSFICATCGYRFNQNNHLQAHMRAHTGIKPYSCNICKESFAWNHHLQRHMKIHQPIICLVCGVEFEREADLRKHTTDLNHGICENLSRIDDDNYYSVHPTVSFGNTDMAFSYPICSQTCNKEIQLLKHFWMHRQRKPHLGSVSKSNFVSCPGGKKFSNGNCAGGYMQGSMLHTCMSSQSCSRFKSNMPDEESDE